MNAKSILAVSVLSMLAALSFSARAADAAESAENKVPAAADVKAPVKKVARHSHLEEKLGVPAKASANADDKPAAASSKAKHNHQRDAK